MSNYSKKSDFLKKIFFLSLLIFTSSNIRSDCNFLTGEYIDEIANPSEISLIEIEIPKSSKYFKNLFEIYSSKSQNIPPKLRKNFKANVTIHFSFGMCNYQGSIRQSGDWKDHVGLNDGQLTLNSQLIRSLDVKLKEGNIANAVSFKLLIPDTRNGLNEVLGSLILKDLGFISPETFEVNTSVNGVNSIMLFQEKSTKELLEKNLRREGPIFEGDESLIWSYKNYDNFELEPLSLSRLVNDSWFEKGENSQAIVLNAFAILQQAYLQYGYINFNEKNRLTIFPNLIADDTFINYHSALLAMNGMHGLRPHNRKYYFNALDSSFQPIYYDGDLTLNRATDFIEIESHAPIKSILPKKPRIAFIELSQQLNKNGFLRKDFLNRVIDKNEAENFFQNGLKQFKSNMLIYQTNEQILFSKELINENYVKEKYDWYQKFQSKKEVNQQIITDIIYKDNYFDVSFKSGKTYKIITKDISNILSKNEFKDQRVAYLPLINFGTNKNEFKNVSIGNSLIKMSKGIEIEITEDKKTLKFIQSNSFDWVLISGGDLTSWKIIFKGLDNVLDKKEIDKQRFNNYGLTGCLTIYDSLLDQSSFLVSGGGCEDSLNIVNSLGTNVTLIVQDAHADAVDADFSQLSIKTLDIKNAGNDCFDVSGGEYQIDYAILNNCQDKAISIGEKSILTANNLIVNDSNIAVAAKDLSKVSVSMLDATNVNVCAEVKRKKQEFGGAKLEINNYLCSASIDIDSESLFSKREL